MEQKGNKKILIIVILAIILVIGVAVGIRVYNDVQQDPMEELAKQKYTLATLQDHVTIYIMEEVMKSNGTKIEVVSELYNENGWTNDAKEKLKIKELKIDGKDIDLSKYILTENGTVEAK